MRECIKCHIEKNDDEFAVNSDGELLNICKECLNIMVNSPKKRGRPKKDEVEETEEKKLYRECIEKRLKELQSRWGRTPIYQGIEMTIDIYEELEDFFQDKVLEFKGQTLSKIQETTIIDAIRMRVAARHLMARGDEGYVKLIRASEDLLASEQLRKKDERPVEKFRIDSQVKSLEDAGFIEKGCFLNAEETAKVIAKNFAQKRKYDYSIDIVDDVLFDIINTMKQNQDEPILTELPENVKADDVFGECLPEASEEEKKRKKYAGLVKNRE